MSLCSAGIRAAQSRRWRATHRRRAGVVSAGWQANGISSAKHMDAGQAAEPKMDSKRTGNGKGKAKLRGTERITVYNIFYISNFTPIMLARCRCFTITPTERYLRGGEFVGRVSPRSGTRKCKKYKV
jgi:hypothetical protein